MSISHFYSLTTFWYSNVIEVIFINAPLQAIFENEQLSSEKKCLRCASECETCSGPAKNQCLSCRQKENTQLVDNTCITGKLIIGYYLNKKSLVFQDTVNFLNISCWEIKLLCFIPFNKIPIIREKLYFSDVKSFAYIVL